MKDCFNCVFIRYDADLRGYCDFKNSHNYRKIVIDDNKSGKDSAKDCKNFLKGRD